MPTLSAICYSDSFAVTTQEMVAAVRSQGLESVVAKRRDSRYEPGQRIGAWVKMRIGGGQEFVIAAIPQVRKLLMHSWSAITRETSLSLSRGCVTASLKNKLDALERWIEAHQKERIELRLKYFCVNDLVVALPIVDLSLRERMQHH